MENKAVDALSRMPPSVHLNQLTAPALLELIVIKDEVEKGPWLSEIIVELKKNEECVAHFSLHQGVLKYKGRVVITQRYYPLYYILVKILRLVGIQDFEGLINS